MSNRVLCVIEALTTGGAQRQLHHLAAMLRGRGDHVSLLTYHLVDYNHREHFRDAFEQIGVDVTSIGTMGASRQFLAFRRAIRASDPDLVISFLRRPSIMTELASLPARRFGLIVSERTGINGTLTFGQRLSLQLHRLADAVVINSSSLEAFTRNAAPWLAPKIHRITNCVDLDYFRAEPPPAYTGSLRVVVVGRFRPEKNHLALLDAVDVLRRGALPVDVVVDAYGNDFLIGGRPTARSKPFLDLQDDVRRRGLEGVFRLHPPVRDVRRLYHDADVLCLPSTYESFPNVVGEAMACGRPVLASATGDNVHLVRDGDNGFLFDSKSPGALAAAIRRFAALPAGAREAMGRSSRRRAEEMLCPQTMADRWSRVIDNVLVARARGMR